MVDQGRVTRLLRGIAERTDRLSMAIASPLDTRGDLWLDGAKYLFVTAIEGCVDVAQHIGSSERFRAPDSNAEAITLLADHDVITSELAERLARAVGFRNVLVHQYAHVDDDIVMRAFDRLPDFRDFVADVSTWLRTQRD